MKRMIKREKRVTVLLYAREFDVVFHLGGLVVDLGEIDEKATNEGFDFVEGFLQVIV